MVIDEVRHGTEVRLAGRLDAAASADVREALAAAVGSGRGDLYVDVASVELVDATGLGVLVGAHRRAQRTGRVLVLRDPSDRLLRVLSLTRLDRVLALARSAATA